MPRVLPMSTPSNTPKKYSNEDLKKWKREINAGIVIAKRISLQRVNDEWTGC